MEEFIVKNSVVALLTVLFSLLFWGLSWAVGLLWYWWFVPILYIGIYSIMD
ncbi:MAG: hypothetical protein HY602_00740 [Parcubacteria group bacterium]|nr:hypothetical protein [Parcubacteria group bacterium]